jgi:hypothetical protein
MGVNPGERERLREELRTGNVDEADVAMSLLLDVESPESLSEQDFAASLDAMERLGEPGQARMFETFTLLASRFPEVSVPVVVEALARSPLGWSGKLSAAVIREVLEYAPGGRAYLDRGQVVPVLAGAVDAAAQTGTDSGVEAIRTLHDWSAHEPLPEAGPAIANWLLRAADEDEPNEYFLRLARETLEANNQLSLLAQVREQAKSLPPDHPLRRVLET